MTTVVNLRVQGLDFNDVKTAERLHEEWGAELILDNGLILLQIYVENDTDVINSVTDTLKQVQQAFPEFKAESVYKDLVSLSDIAVRVGVSKEAVRKWVQHDNLCFPAHVSSIGNAQKIWDWLDVYEWLFDVKSIDMDEDLPTRTQIVQIDACLAGVPDKTQLEWEKVENPAQVTRTIDPQVSLSQWIIAKTNVRLVDVFHPPELLLSLYGEEKSLIGFGGGHAR